MRSRWVINGFGTRGIISCFYYSRELDELIAAQSLYPRWKSDVQKKRLADCFHWLDNAFYIYYTVPKITRRSEHEESI